MKKMFLMLAIMALATGAFAAWGDVVQTYIETGTDTTGVDGDPATIFANFTMAPIKFNINIDDAFDTWDVTGILPDDAGWQEVAHPFSIENVGGATIDIGLAITDDDDLTLAGARAYSAPWAGGLDNYSLWAIIGDPGLTAPTTDATDMAAANHLTAINVWADEDNFAPFTVAADAYTNVRSSGLNLYAGGADEADLVLGFQCSGDGWTTLTEQVVDISVTCRLAVAP